MSAEKPPTLLKPTARKRRIAVLCSLHPSELATRHADRFIALKQGRIVLNALPDAVSPEQLTAIYCETADLDTIPMATGAAPADLRD